MATIPQTERNTAVDTLMALGREDSVECGRYLDYLRTAFPGFTWDAILRTRAAAWAPYIASGLSISAFCDEAIRQANFFRDSRG